MDSPLLKAQHYLDQAEKMRGLAASESDEMSRNALIKLSKGYERLSEKFLLMGQDAARRKP